jgi:hypothetical protein
MRTCDGVSREPDVGRSLIGSYITLRSWRDDRCATSASRGHRTTPEYLEKFVQSEIAKWAVPIKAGKISVD